MKIKTLLGLTILITFWAACSPQTQVATHTPDIPATEAHVDLLAQQTAQSGAATVTREFELTSAADTQAAVRATQDAVNAQQAALEADQNALDSEQAALSSAQEELSAASTEAAAYAVTLQAESAALATANSDLTEGQTELVTEQQALTDGQATLSADQQESSAISTENAVNAATNEAIVAVNEEIASQLASGQQALAATAEALAATETALAPTATQLPPTAIPWQEVTLPEWGIELLLPPELGEPLHPDDDTVTFEEHTTGGPTPSGVTLSRVPTANLFDGSDLTGADLNDPISVLSVALREPLEESLFTVVDDVRASTALPYTGASVLVAMAEFDKQAWIGLFKLATDESVGDDWLAIAILGTPDQLTAWTDPILQSLQIAPLDAPEPTPLPAEEITTPTLEPIAIPTEESSDTHADMTAALDLEFIVPEGWTGLIQEDRDFARPLVELSAPQQTHMITLARPTLAEISQAIITEIPADADALTALSPIMVYLNAAQGDFSGGRVSEVAIENFSGAWSQLRNDTEVTRYYLFPTGQDEWLFIQVIGPRDTFNQFNQNELREFLAALALLPSEGVALGLDFVIPEGWALEPGDEHNTRLVAPEDISQEIALSRGMAEEFDLPADLRDPAEALRIIAEVVNAELALGSNIRVEQAEIANMPGAYTTLRNDDLMARLYLLPIGDEWLFIMANAPRADFNGFNRTELRDFFASLQLANAAEQAPVTISEPLGPVEEVTVVRVSDGDTIYVLLAGLEESVRIIGIDTPEAHHPDSGADRGGYAATHFIETLTPAGSTVYLESDIRDRDDYDRLLRYVWVKDENGDWLNVEAELIRAGRASVSTYDEERYVQAFHALEQEARNAERGIWGPAPPPPPVESLATRNDAVWAANPDGEALPMLYDAAALGNVPAPYGVWPNNIPAIVRDVYYVYPTDIDPVTDQPVSAEKVGYWYWLEINDFRGWVPESWLLLEEPATAANPPATDIIAYAQPFIATEEALAVLESPGTGPVLGTFAPESRVQVEKLAYHPATDTWWLFADTKTLDGWVPLASLNRLNAANR
ncbi:thermonuclease family protein [Chloroflexota bacterium]